MKERPGIMTHIVAGYPSFDDNRKLIGAMARAGVAYIEIQIPFSDPVADGPTILHANQSSLNNGTTVKDCLDFARDMAGQYQNVTFLFMSYYNILFNYGVENFIGQAARCGMYGLIVPDIPLEEDGGLYYRSCLEKGIKPVYVISPTTSRERLALIGHYAGGFIYCTSRIGITGNAKDINKKLGAYVKTVKKITGMPVAVGFGIDSAQKALEIGRFADIIVIGSKVLRIMEQEPQAYEKAVYTFLHDISTALSQS
ncbi:MAG: tryptophan synthase subunit alpha [Spirochaetae bacterium HGW-Spirochaetae-1]|jgi:tryptophan synthase alpha chain|nr:MAG: tryptophan synthase subunit alpha [Spirochaetae bacterium HGW-Spirochaetae-1]